MESIVDAAVKEDEKVLFEEGWSELFAWERGVLCLWSCQDILFRQEHGKFSFQVIEFLFRR